MAADTVTNFLIPTKDVFTDVMNKLGSIAGVGTIHMIAGDKLDELLRHAPAKTLLPLVCLVYQGSSFQQRPRRNYKFAVVVGTRTVTNDRTAQNNTFDLLDQVIGAIDHEEYANQLIYKVVSDQWQDYTNSGMTIYRTEFIAEDY